MRRTALLRIGLALAGLLVAEAAVRLVARLAHRERGLRSDATVGWRPLPNVTRVGAHWSSGEPARTNALGWRDAEFTYERSPNVRRIVAIGDSFTWGASVDYGERYTEVLERSVPALDVVVLGVNAFGPDQELLLLETEGLRFSPDVVIAQLFLGNDLDDVRYRRHFAWPKPHFELEGETLRLYAPESTWDVRLRESSYLGELVYRALDRWIPADERAPNLATRDTVPLLGALYARMHAAVDAYGAKLLVVIVYPHQRASAPPTVVEERMRRTLEDRSIAVLDLHRAFLTSTDAGDALFAPDGHWNAAGHALAAAEIGRDLAARGWLQADEHAQARDTAKRGE